MPSILLTYIHLIIYETFSVAKWLDQAHMESDDDYNEYLDSKLLNSFSIESGYDYPQLSFLYQLLVSGHFFVILL